MAKDVNINHARPSEYIGLGKESVSAALLLFAKSHQHGAPSYPIINNNNTDAYTTVSDALQVRQALIVILFHSYLYLLHHSRPLREPPAINHSMGVDESRGNIKNAEFASKLLPNPWIVVGRAFDVRSVGLLVTTIVATVWGIKTITNCLKVSVGSKKWSDWFLLFYSTVINYAQYVRSAVHSSSLFSGFVIGISKLWWIVLLVACVSPTLLLYSNTPVKTTLSDVPSSFVHLCIHPSRLLREPPAIESFLGVDNVLRESFAGSLIRSVGLAGVLDLFVGSLVAIPLGV